MTDVKALILAGGNSTRMGDLTKDTPKCLLKVGKKSIIENQVDCLHNFGIKNIYIVLGPNPEKVKNILGNKVRYIINKEYKTTGTLYGTYLAKKELYGKTFLKIYGDLLFNDKFLANLVDKEDDISILCNLNEYVKEQMYVNVQSNILKDIRLNMERQNISGYWSMLTKLNENGSKLIFDEMEEVLKDERNFNAHFGDVIFNNLIKKGVSIKVYDNKELIYNVNRPDELDYAIKVIAPKLGL